MNEIATRGSSWPTREHDLLLQAASLEGPFARAAWLQWQASTDFDLIDDASRSLLPLLYHNLSRQGISGPNIGHYKGLYRRAWYMNQLLLHHLEELLRTLNEAGIPNMILGGTALIVRSYRDHGLRPLDRGNILVPRNQADRIPHVVRRSGWAVVGYSPRCPAWDLLGPAGQRVTVQGHALPRPAVNRSGADADFWDAAPQILFRQVPTRALDHPDELLQVCASTIISSPTPDVSWVVDILSILRSAGPRFDWDRLVGQAERCRMVLPVREALGYVHQKLGAPVPAQILSSLDGAPVTFSERMLYQAATSGGLPLGRVVRLWSRELKDGSVALPGKLVELARYVQDRWDVPKLWQLPGHALVRAARKAASRIRVATPVESSLEIPESAAP